MYLHQSYLIEFNTFIPQFVSFKDDTILRHIFYLVIVPLKATSILKRIHVTCIFSFTLGQSLTPCAPCSTEESIRYLIVQLCIMYSWRR